MRCRIVAALGKHLLRQPLQERFTNVVAANIGIPHQVLLIQPIPVGRFGLVLLMEVMESTFPAIVGILPQAQDTQRRDMLSKFESALADHIRDAIRTMEQCVRANVSPMKYAHNVIILVDIQ